MRKLLNNFFSLYHSFSNTRSSLLEVIFFKKIRFKKLRQFTVLSGYFDTDRKKVNVNVQWFCLEECPVIPKTMDYNLPIKECPLIPKTVDYNLPIKECPVIPKTVDYNLPIKECPEIPQNRWILVFLPKIVQLTLKMYLYRNVACYGTFYLRMSYGALVFVGCLYIILGFIYYIIFQLESVQ